MNKEDKFSLMTHMVALLNQGPLAVTDLAQELDITPGRVKQLVGYLLLCATPPYGADDYFNISCEGDIVKLHRRREFRGGLRLSLREALVIKATLEAWVAGQGPFSQAAQSLVSKIGQHLDFKGQAMRQVMNQSGIDTLLTLIDQALREERALDIEVYVASRDEISRRRVIPVKVRRRQGAFTLDAWCLVRDAMRSFRVDRLFEISLADVHPLTEAMKKGWDAQTEDFEDHHDHVVLKMPRMVADRYESILQDAEVIAHDHQDEVMVHLKRKVSVHTALWALSLGPRVQVMEPQSLKDLMLERVEAVRQHTASA